MLCFSGCKKKRQVTDVPQRSTKYHGYHMIASVTANTGSYVANLTRIEGKLNFLTFPHIQDVSGGIVNILGVGSMDYSE